MSSVSTSLLTVRKVWHYEEVRAVCPVLSLYALAHWFVQEALTEENGKGRRDL